MSRIATLFLIALAFQASGAFGAEISWVLYEPDCGTPPPGALRIEAGKHGVFYFDAEPSPACPPPAAFGSELVPVYPEPASPPPTLPCNAGLGGESDDGSDPNDCSTPFDKVNGPWIAVIDWNNWHGHSVSWTVAASTHPAIETVLFPLRQTFPECPGITDVDVLARLAEIAQKVDNGAPPLLAINMSFGRFPEADDPVDRDCEPNTLSCQISQLLAHLVQPLADDPPDIAAVAAAGNHREILFPASLEHVVPAGSLDLAAFVATDGDTAEASWETPAVPIDSALALMPGSALCLPLGFGGPPGWPAPPGTSYATAVFSGWVAEAIYHQPDRVRRRLLDPLWQPHLDCSGGGACEVELAHGGRTFKTPGGDADELVHEALFGKPAACGQGSGQQLTIDTEMSTTVSPFNHDSLVRLVATTHQPAPAPDPCVPCALPSPFGGPENGVADRRVMTETTPVELEIDLHASWRLPKDLELLALFVRFGEEVQAVALDEQDLEDLANGDVAYLNIKGTLKQVHDPDVQPSLMSVQRSTDSDDLEELFWDSTPLTLREP